MAFEENYFKVLMFPEVLVFKLHIYIYIIF